VDFSWVKQLADAANQQELAKQEEERRVKETRKKVALATCPFVEKIFTLINAYAEEFNKHCMFPRLRVTTTKLYKRSRTGEESTAEPDEVAYFNFTRGGYMYAIRGINGLVEFLEMPITEGSSNISIKIDELGVSPSKTFAAELETKSDQVVWNMKGQTLDGPLIITECQTYFCDFIVKTNQ
jgi:hypothetical protein